MAHVVELRRYVLKGAAGRSVDYLEVSPAIGVIGDRQFAFKKKASVPDAWSPKGMFFVAMNTAQMPAQQPVFAGDRLDTGYLEHMGQVLGLDGPPAVLATEGRYNISDTKGASVSFLNLASVKELSDYMGCEINPYRFRMNMHLGGLDPFEELTWVTEYPGMRIITIGEVEFRVDDACERCKAVEANPETGTYDLEVLDALEALLKSRGYPGSPHRQVHRVMGVLACPLSHGYIGEGDRVLA